MSYLVLARKWRPQKFEDVVNQKHVVLTLQNALKTKRLANAYLFAGPRGIGKTTIARILTKSINCEKGPAENPCNECDSCKDITDGRSLDVLEIDGASNRGIDEVRNLRESLKYAPNPGKYKIYIIDEVHMLTTEAFNALLKTLEEPPSRVMFIFATTEPHKVPATIISRCQRFDFKRISLTEIIQQLKLVCNRENIEIDDDSLHLIARKAEGSMRDSQSLLDQAISFCGTKISANDIIDLMGVIDWEIFFKFTNILSKQDLKGGFELVENIFNNGYDLVEFLLGLSEHLRNILITRATNTTDFIEASDSFRARYQEIASNFEEPYLLLLIQIASEAQTSIKRSANPRLHLEMIITKILQLNRAKKIDTLLQNIDTLKEKIFQSDIIGKAGIPKIQPVSNRDNVSTRNYHVAENQNELSPKDDGRIQTSIKEKSEEEKPKEAEAIDTNLQNVSNGAISIESIRQQWPYIVEMIKKRKIALGSFLNEGTPEEIVDDELIVSFGLDNSFHVSSINRNRKSIEQIIAEIIGTPLKIKCIQKESASSKENSPATGNGYIDKLGQKIPLIKTIVDEFDGELIK